MNLRIPPLLWTMRGLLLVVAVIAPWNDVATHSTPVNALVIAMGWIAWAMCAVSALVVLPVALTALRVAMPVVVLLCATATTNNDHIALSVAALVCALCAATCLVSPTVIDAMVQGSAFGKETRFALRTPVPYLAPAVVSWLLLVSAVMVGPLLLAAREFVAGAIVTVVALVLVTRVPPRLHRLARRWLVMVPAGMVVHDHLVLAETLMVRTHDTESVERVESPGDEADFTGGVFGRRIRIALREPSKVVLSPLTSKVLGTSEALHVKSFSVSPLRTDAALAAARRETN